MSVGASVIGVMVSRDGKHVYTANGAAGTISVIDAGTNTVVGTFASANAGLR